jgi:hypothetical protein
VFGLAATACTQSASAEQPHTQQPSQYSRV